jgi:hypothetical protein
MTITRIVDAPVGCCFGVRISIAHPKYCRDSSWKSPTNRSHWTNRPLNQYHNHQNRNRSPPLHALWAIIVRFFKGLFPARRE